MRRRQVPGRCPRPDRIVGGFGNADRLRPRPRTRSMRRVRAARRRRAAAGRRTGDGVAGPARRPRDRQSSVPVTDGTATTRGGSSGAVAARTRTPPSSSSPSPASWSIPTVDASHWCSHSPSSHHVTPPTSERRSVSGPTWSGRGGPAAGCSTHRYTCACWPSNSDAPNPPHADRTGHTWSRAATTSRPCLPTVDGRHARRSGPTQRQLPRRVLRHDPRGRRSRRRTTAHHLRSRRPGPVVVGRAIDHVREATFRAAARRPRPTRRPHGPMGERRLVPKVLVANQTRIVEAVCDPHGEWLPAVPVLGIYPIGSTLGRRRPAHARPARSCSLGDRCRAHVAGRVGLVVGSGRWDRHVGRRDPIVATHPRRPALAERRSRSGGRSTPGRRCACLRWCRRCRIRHLRRRRAGRVVDRATGADRGAATLNDAAVETDAPANPVNLPPSTAVRGRRVR